MVSRWPAAVTSWASWGAKAFSSSKRTNSSIFMRKWLVACVKLRQIRTGDPWGRGPFWGNCALHARTCTQARGSSPKFSWRMQNIFVSFVARWNSDEQRDPYRLKDPSRKTNPRCMVAGLKPVITLALVVPLTSNQWPNLFIWVYIKFFFN